MKERLYRQGDEGRELLALARKLTGRQPEIKRVRQLPSGARAMLVRTLNPKRPYEIRVLRSETALLSHLVAHEIGHLVRLHQVPESERLAPISAAANWGAAVRQMVEELAQVVTRLRIREGAIAGLFDGWFRGVCTQLSSFPADLRIEQWIHDEFPGLRAVQRKSLTGEVTRSYPSFLPEIEASVPKTIYRATMAMNAAQAWHVGELYGVRELTRPFEEHGYLDRGRDLARLVFGQQDQGHRSDVEASRRWADILGLKGWVEWVELSDERCLGIEVGTR